MIKKIAFAPVPGGWMSRSDGLPGSSEPLRPKPYTPEGQVQGVRLDVEDREVEVALSPDEQVHLQYGENSEEY